MKICSVTFSNLNSLAGTFSVDLENPELTSAGIFLITGPTGSGKSTLMDAIAYGLYAKTPRQDSTGKKENELMSRDFATCSSSVVFEQGGARYTVTSEHRRNKGRKENADPFAPPERRLEQQQQDGTWVELCNGPNAVKAAIAEITGMADIEAFRRCMMLAQGEFTEFLTMNEQKRAALLSTITQTEEYATLGEMLFERAREAELEMEKLQAHPTLPEEERHAQETRAAGLRQARQQRKEAQETCRAALQWHADRREKEQACAAARTKQEEAEARRRAFAESGRLLTLQRALRACEAEPDEQRRDAETRQRRAQETLLEATHGRLKELAPQMQQAEEAHRLAEQAARTRLPELEEARTVLNRDIRPAEQALRAALIRGEEQQRQAAEAEAKRQAAREAERRAEQEAAQWRDRYRRLQQELEQLAPFAGLPAAMADIKARQIAWRETGNSTPLPPTADIEARLRELRAEQERVSGGREPGELRASAAALAALRRDHHLAEAAARRLTEERQRAATAQAELDALAAPLAETEEKAELLRTAEARIRELASMQDKLDECYRKFCAGEYKVCPCCGASTPGEHRSIGAGELAAAEAATRQATAALQELRRRQDAAARTKARADAACAETQTALAEHRQAVEGRRQQLGLEELPADLDKRIAAEEQAAEQGEALTRACTAAEQERTAAALRDALHRALSPFPASLPATAREAETLVKTLARTATRFTDLSAERQTTAARAEEKEQAQHKAGEMRRAADAEHAACAARAAEQQQRCLEQQKELSDRCGGKSADELEQAYLQEERGLRERQQQSLAALTARRQEHTALRSAQEEQDKHLQQMRHAEAEALARFLDRLREQGFANEADYAAAKRSGEERRALAEEQERTETELTRARSAAEVQQRTLQQHLDKPHADATEEELQAQGETLREQLAAAEQELTDCLAVLKMDDEHRAANRHINAQREELRAAHARWQLLKEILGGTKDSFQKYAQSITFDALIAAANRHLQQLFPRFILTQNHSKGALQLGVTDLWLDDTTPRQVSNLSGGETFVVSLALALALSGLSNSRVSIDTLFLDEGFGTLDPDTLHTVITALEELRLNGKLIGIITHVEALKDIFPPACNIQVEKLGNSGYSTLRPAPGVRAEPAEAESRGTRPRRRSAKRKKQEAAQEEED